MILHFKVMSSPFIGFIENQWKYPDVGNFLRFLDTIFGTTTYLEVGTVGVHNPNWSGHLGINYFLERDAAPSHSAIQAWKCKLLVSGSVWPDALETQRILEITPVGNKCIFSKWWRSRIVGNERICKHIFYDGVVSIFSQKYVKNAHVSYRIGRETWTAFRPSPVIY